MASQKFHDGGGTGPFSFSFPSLEQSDIKVTVDGQQESAFQINNYNSTTGGEITIPGGTASGTQNVRIYRQTEPEKLSATFVAGSSIAANDLNNCNKQTLFLADEIRTSINNLALGNTGSAIQISGSNIADSSISSSKIVDLQVKAVDLSSHTSDDNERAVTTDHIRDNAVTTAKISDDNVTADKLKDSASTDSDRAVTTNHIRDGAVTDAKLATISGTKISPDFGGQGIVTTGGLNSGAITSTGSISGTHGNFNGEVYIGGPTGTAADTRFLDTHISTTHAFHIRATAAGDQDPHNVICSFGHDGTVGTVSANRFNGNANGPAWYMTHPKANNDTSEFSVARNTDTIISNYQTNESGSYPEGGLSTSNGSFTVPTGRAGMYVLIAGVIIINLDSNDDLNVFFFKNGSKLTPVGENNSPANDVQTGASIVRLGNFAEGDVIQAGVRHAHGSTALNLQGSNCYFGGFRLAL